MKHLVAIPNALAAGILCILSFHLAIGDGLLFSSDTTSLSIYLGAAGLLIGLFFAAGSLLAGLSSRGRNSPRRLSSALLGTFFLVGLLAAGCSLLYPVLARLGQKSLLLQISQALSNHWVFLLAAALPLLVIIGVFRLTLKFLRGQPETQERLEKLGFLLCGASLFLIVLGWFQLSLPTSRSDQDAPPKHLVLLIIDRMPSWALSSYSPDAEPTAFDLDLKDQARVFLNMQSSQPYTHAFFGSLYRGTLPGDPPGEGLIGRLSRHGVDVSLMYDHRAASPEGSAAQRSNYAGLRSRLLGPLSAAIPAYLGLQHHVATVTPRPNEGFFIPPLWKLLNPGQPGVDVLEEFLLPSVRQATSRSRQSFALFHISLSRFNAESYSERSPQFAAQGEHAIITAARTNGYRYPSSPDADKVVKQYRDFTAEDVRHFSQKFRTFLAGLRADPNLRDVNVIVTSDHGTMYEKGRLFYGYHPQREVVRVPFLTFGDPEPGNDPRLLGTLDLSHSILNFFDADIPPLAEKSVSLFEKNSGSDETATLTLKSDHQKEWFLVLYRGESVFRINIHKDASFKIEALRYDQFDEIALEITDASRRQILDRARHWAARFLIDLNDTNLPQ